MDQQQSEKSYFLWTVGCQMNVADSNYIGAALDGRGYVATEQMEGADVVVLNSCSVRASAEERIAGKLGELAGLKRRRPNTFVALTGCMVTDDQTTLKRRFPMVDLFFKPSAMRDFLVGLPDNSAPDLGEYGVSLALEGLLPNAQAGAVAAYIPIIYGCNKTCTYCIVPFRRGRERSRTIPDIVREISGLTERGVREVTLLGQNVDTYGHDLAPRTDLADLLIAVNDVPKLDRIRFLTSHPKDMSQRLLDTVALLPKACEHINLPVQAGDDEMLRRMRRRYTLRYYHDLVRRIRETIPNVTLATDIIVGFPGETAAQFENTMGLLREVRFDKVHVAAYSPRPGTVSATWEDDVPHEEKMRRLHAIETLQEQMGHELNDPLVGTTLEVLVEARERGKWTGRTRGNKIVFFPGAATDPHRGQVRRVQITAAGAWSLTGELAEAVPAVGPGTQFELVAVGP
ncbi:MAG: tRNA (N6-isopentenyl adenosine(37)-C2)-methylthiotransferase MiaB [Chloroflexota bacterium]|nr:tRNA (N6-isopentenyl adenosine(37)-C2)-methylthiotransferase MiaB [Chloroflexota bacterium]